MSAFVENLSWYADKVNAAARRSRGPISATTLPLRCEEGEVSWASTYVPEKDYKAAYWMKNFARRLVERADDYRIAPQEAAEIDAAVQLFRATHAKLRRIEFKTFRQSRVKSAARKAAERLVRPAYQRIRTDPRIAAELKVAVGVRLTKKRRRLVGPPAGVPSLTAKTDLSGRVTLLVVDAGSSRKAKPADANGFELFQRIRSQVLITAMRERGIRDDETPDAVTAAAIAAPIGEAPGLWRYAGTFTATPIILAPAITAVGDEVTFAARWVNRRGEPGRFSSTVTAYPMFNPAAALDGARRRTLRRPVA